MYREELFSGVQGWDFDEEDVVSKESGHIARLLLFVLCFFFEMLYFITVHVCSRSFFFSGNS